MHPPAGLESLARKKGDCGVRMDVPCVAPNIHSRILGILSERNVNIENEPLIHPRTKHAPLPPLENHRTERNVPEASPTAMTAGIDVCCGQHSLRAVPGAQKALTRDPCKMCQACPAVHIRDLRQNKSVGICTPIIVGALSDLLDESSGKRHRIEEAGVAQVHGGKGW